MLDHLLNNRIQAQLATPLDALLASNPLATVAKNYLIACKVEGLSFRTVETYAMVISRYLGFAGETEPTANQIRQFLLSLQEGKLSPSSVHIYYRGLKTFFNWLVAEEFIPKSPMENIRSPRVPKTIIKPFSRQDIDNLLLLCSGNRFLDLRNKAIILVFIDTGLRLSELASIQLIDVNFDHETIKVMGKGAKERVVRIGKTAQKALLRYLLTRHDDYPCLWVTEERRPMAVSAIQIAIKRMCRRAGITDARLGPHTFRHTFATSALRNGASPFEVQSLLGHSTLTMTRKYTETLRSEDAAQAHKRFSPVDNMRLK